MKLLDQIIGARRSLRRRLMTNIIIALLLCVTLAGTIFISEFYQHLEENAQDALFLEAQEVLGQIDPTAPSAGLDPDSLRIKSVEGAYRYTVLDGAGQPIAGSEITPDIWAQLSHAALGQKVNVILPGDRIAIGVRAKIGGQDVFVLVSTFPKGTDATQLQNLLKELGEQFWWVILGGAMIFAAAFFATHRALASLKQASRQAGEIGPFGIDKRLSVNQVPAEIQPLIQAVNGAFDRLELGYQAQRDFSSNVAHEIRTPLAVLRSSVDRISDADLRESLTEDLSRLDQIFEQLIDLARADALRGNNFTPVSLRDVVMEQSSVLAIEALQAGRSLGVNGSVDGVVTGHAGLLGIALKNLVRNALHYAPKGSEVEIEVTQNPLGIQVLDAGPGVPDALKAGLFERFNRGKSDHNSDGSGIGLAIVQSVARAHGATASVTDRSGQGCIFAITWPE
jgi:signal transduction histidine kinase